VKGFRATDKYRLCLPTRQVWRAVRAAVRAGWGLKQHALGRLGRGL
jgi:hypothetical protein